MHLQSTSTPHLQHLQWEAHMESSRSTSNGKRIWNPVEHLWWRFFAEIVNLLRPLAVFATELHPEGLTGF